MRSVILVLAACGSAPPPASASPAAKPVAPAEPSESAAIPLGYIEMHAEQVVGVGDGAALMLVDAQKLLALPVFIGGTEATSIELRLHGEHFKRPLTHDLLDHVMQRLHASLVKVQVDSLVDGTYIGSIYVRTEGRIIKIDARPSDAIALAIGDHAPIYVARTVLDEAAMKWDEVQKQLQAKPNPES